MIDCAMESTCAMKPSLHTFETYGQDFDAVAANVVGPIVSDGCRDAISSDSRS
jgi:hypothetical protein